MDIIIITLTKNELHKKVYIKIYFKQEGFTGFSFQEIEEMDDRIKVVY